MNQLIKRLIVLINGYVKRHYLTTLIKKNGFEVGTSNNFKGEIVLSKV